MAETGLNDILAAYVVMKYNKKEKVSTVYLGQTMAIEEKELSLTNIMAELKLYPDFRNFIRMDEDMYLMLLQKVSPLIEKQNYCFAKSIKSA